MNKYSHMLYTICKKVTKRCTKIIFFEKNTKSYKITELTIYILDNYK